MFKKESSRFLRIGLLAACAVVLIIGGTVLWLAHSGKPVRTGEMPISGLTSEVSVRWDRWGVPHITGESAADVLSGLGWVHANDRFVQMELGRRAAHGRLSEVLGEAAVETDTYFHRMRFPASVDRLWGDASPQSRTFLEAYANGVNAWLAERGGDLPPALRLLGIEPEPWRPQDSLSFSLLMAQDLGFWQQRPEEKRFRWLRHFGLETVQEILAEPELHVDEAVARLAAELPETGDGQMIDAVSEEVGGGPSPGSNNWALGGRHTASGQPIIANDPHLGLFLPSVWYQVMLRSPDYEAAGMTLPGTPGVVIGRGRHVAWAFTNTMLDDHDLFFEELDASGTQYRRGEDWIPLETHEASLAVRGGETRQLTFYSTDHGPLLEADPSRGLPARSVAWTAHHGGDPVAALYGLATSRTPEQTLEAIEPYVAPAQNLVASFDDGALLYTVLGRIPHRRGEPGGDLAESVTVSDGVAEVAEEEEAHSLRVGLGRLPAPGWDRSYGWDGLRPRSSNPAVIRPASDMVVTANQDIRPAEYGLPLAADFFPPYRADRIQQRLEARGGWKVEDVAALQLDVHSLFARRVIEALEGDAAALSGASAKAYEALASWDGNMEVQGISALFTLVEKHLRQGVFGDETEAASVTPFDDEALLLDLLEGRLGGGWFDDVSTPTVETRSEIVAAALTAAWQEGSQRWGEDPAAWSYGWLHSLTLRHRLDAVPVLGSWLRRGPYEVHGSSTTVSAYGAAWQGERRDSERQEILYGPSMRWIVDWSAPESAFAALPGGQSGHPRDPHYDDQIEPFLRGELRPAPWSEAAIQDATVSTLTLVPAVVSVP